MSSVSVRPTLREVLIELHKQGVYDDFRKDGLPKVTVVSRRLGRRVSRRLVDAEWRALFGFSTCREKLD